MEYWRNNDIFYADLAPYVIITINFATSSTNNIAEENQL